MENTDEQLDGIENDIDEFINALAGIAIIGGSLMMLIAIAAILQGGY